MQNKDLQHLEWPLLLTYLAKGAQSAQGHKVCLNLEVLDREEIEKGWAQQLPVRDLIRSGYVPPIGSLEELDDVFRGAKLGQVFDGEDLLKVQGLLKTVRQLKRFLLDFEEKCPPLSRFAQLIYPLPELCQAILNTVGDEGEVLDSASAELARIRKSKLSLRKQIEQNIRGLLTEGELETYIQDKFFTVRAERYVIPMRLDGRGRVEGSIYDTSDSGQTLYIEPKVIRPLNESLLDLELSEKLEIVRIFKELSAHIARELDVLKDNYKHLIELDVLVAKATLAHKLDAGPVKMSDHAVLDLKNARHPILQLQAETPPVDNHITLKEGKESCLIISGPNAGGKTVALKTCGLLHLMARVGLLLPADESSRLYLFEKTYLALGDPQSLAANLSTFSGHLLTIKPILEQADTNSLVLLDELAAGTEPQTGSAIAQAILEDLAEKKAHTIATTHYDTLKALATQNSAFRNGSMEFSTTSLKPTYKLILDIPGQSYGLEVASSLGLKPSIIERAKVLRGQSGSDLDGLLRTLSQSQDALREKEAQLEQSRLAMETQKYHWEKERKELSLARQKAGEKIQQNYENRVDRLSSQVETSLKTLKNLIKEAKESGGFDIEKAEKSLLEEKQSLKKNMQVLDDSLRELASSFAPQKALKGRACSIEELKVGSKVYLISLEREGIVTRLSEGSQPLEVQAGLLKLRPTIHEIRLMEGEVKAVKQKNKVTKAKAFTPKTKSSQIPFSPQGKTNTVDLRGLDQERALERMWQFLDGALMRGESTVIAIHGHGTAALKRAVRSALLNNSPYDLDFRPGDSNEGGDGVTVIQFNS